jgi:DNA modification methylase
MRNYLLHMKKPEKLTIEYWAPGRIRPYQKNARAHPPEQVAAIVANIRGTRFMKPLLVDERGEILAGHGAFMAAQQIGMTEIPVIQHRGLTQAQKRAYRIADNKVAEQSIWDTKILLDEFAELRAMGADLGLTGFAEKEIELMLRPPPSDRSEPPERKPGGRVVTQLGDLWLLGEHRLLCADSTKATSLKTLMGGAQAQCVFTDPPYGISYEAPSGDHAVIKGDDLRRGKLQTMLHGAFVAAMPHVRQDAGWYIWHASGTREEFSRAMRDVGLVELSTIIWAKPGQVLGWSDYRWSHEPCFYAARQGVKPAFHGDRSETTVWRLRARKANGEALTAIGSGVTLVTKDGQEIHVGPVPKNGKKVRHVYADETVLLQQSGGPADNVWEVSRGGGHGKENTIHPTMKPVELARRAIGNSTREGEIVLDLFAGSSSTIIGAEQTGRLGYALELDPKYVDAGVRRWQDLTGKQATHAADKKTFDAIAKSRAAKARPR